MPIFDNISVNQDNPLLASPQLTQVTPPQTQEVAPEKSREGLSGEQLIALSKAPQKPFDLSSPLQSIPQSELIANQRYPLYRRDSDLENVYGLQQSWYDRLANSAVKFAATTVGTFAQGFATIPNTISAIKEGKMSELAGTPDGYETSIDNWLKNLEDNFPNYYSRYEQQHPFKGIIPFTTGSANFWGDKVIKNLGFTAGAIGNAVVTDLAIGAVTGGIGEIPLVASQVGKASLWLNKIFTGADKFEGVISTANALGKTEQQLLNVKNLAQIASAVRLGTGARYGLSLYGSARTEAAVEARDAYNTVKEELVKQYKFDNLGQEPTPEDLAQINDYAEDAMNTRFGINMALLTVSNAVQFGNLFKSFSGASKAASKLDDISSIGLVKGSLDVFEAKIGNKLWESVRPTMTNVLTEGVYEEGGQYATERGVYDYYTRKYKNPANKEMWDNFNETITSTVKGLKDQFGTSQGIENMVIGGLTAMVAGAAANKIQSIKGADKDSRTTAAVNTLNLYGLSGTLSQQYSDTLNSASIAKEMEEAAASNDIYKYNNLKDDMFFGYVSSRINPGMHDVTIEQLNMLRDLPKEEFEKTFGMDFNTSTKSTVNAYVDSLIEEANNIKKVADGVNLAFKNPFKNIINPQNEEEAKQTENFHLFNEWKTNLIYYGSAGKRINNRLESLQQSVSQINPLISNELIAQLTDKDSLKELSNEYEESAKTLEKSLNPSISGKERKKIRDNVKALRTASEKVNLAISTKYQDDKVFSYLLNFELNGQDATKDRQVGIEHSIPLINLGVDINKLIQRKNKASKIFDSLSTQEGFEKFLEQEKQIKDIEETLPFKDTSEFINKSGDKEPVQVGREYEISSTRKAKVRKVTDDRFETINPDGSFTFHGTREEAEIAADDVNSDVADLGKVKVLAINPDGTIKVENAKGEISNVPSDALYGYDKIETPQEKLAKFKEALDKDQKNIQDNSGKTGTKDPITDFGLVPFEDKKKSWEDLFTSTTSASEDWEASTLKPHNIRAIQFLNNVKNFPNRGKIKSMLLTPNQENSLGLEGLAALSFDGLGLPVEKYTDLNEGLVASVYVEQDKVNVYFIDEKGKRVGKVGEKVDLSKIVFSTMPSTHITWNDGKTPRYREGQRDQAIEQSKRWELKRKQLFAMPEGKYELYNFSISRGIPVIINPTDRFAVGDVLVPENKISTQEGLIVISTTGYISHLGKNLKFPEGRPVLQYADTLQFLSNNNFTSSQAQAIFEVLKAMSNELNASLAEGSPKLNTKYTKFIHNVLYWRKTKETSNNQIYIDTTSSELFLSGNRYNLTDIANNEEAIVSSLEKVYRNVNDDTLTKEFNEPFIEYYMEGDKLSTRKWVNYQSYLLSSSYPDGSKRNIDDIPLSTSVTPVTDAAPSNFKQKYAILEAIELPELSISKPKVAIEKKITAPKLGEYVIDGKTKNKYKFNAGDVEFTATQSPEGAISVEVESNETIKKIASTPASFKVVTDTLKTINQLDATKSDEELVLRFAAFKISTALQAITKEAPKTEEKTEQSPAKIEVKGKKDFSKTVPPPASEYRRVGFGEIERISSEELELFKKWHKDNVPNIPYEVLENILITHNGEKAWGAFENGVAKFFKSGLKGTEYHEIFEGIWKSFLSNEEKQAILDEFKSKPGTFVDRASDKKIAFDKATDVQAKERIADDFADFRNGKTSAKSLGQKIAQFFKNIIEFFKQFVVKPSKKEQLFKAIDTGRFKKYTASNAQIDIAPEYRAVEGLIEQQSNEFVQDITARVFQRIFATNTSLFNPEKLTAPEIFNQIKAAYEEDGKLEILGETAWNQLVERSKEFLRTFRIEFDENNIVGINDEASDRTLYAPEPFSTNWKKSSSFPIKLLIGTLIETEARNQQGNTTLELPNPKVSPEVNGYTLLNFSRAFATLMDKLSNTTDVSKIVDKVVDLAKFDSNYVRLFSRLQGDRALMNIDFSKFEAQDWRLFVNFFQTFSKQKPDAYIQYVNNYEVYTSSANLFTSIRQIKQDWIENLKKLSTEKGSIVRYNKPTKTYVISDVSSLPIRTSQQMVEFLAKIGINFPISTYNRLKSDASDNQVKQFADAVGAIHKYFAKEKDIMSINGRTLGVNGQLNTLAELLNKVENPNQDMSYFGISQKRMQQYADNNAPSVFENDFNSSNTLEELLETRPELNDVFSGNSVVLKKGGLFFNSEGKRIKEMKVGYIQGTNNIDAGKETSTNKLTLGNRFSQEINQNINGNYYILVPADSSTEWMLNLGNTINFEDSSNGDAWNNIYSIFKGYLKDDIFLAKDDRSYLRNTTPRAKELRFFKDILPSKILSDINTLINNGTDEEIDLFVESNLPEINAAVKAYIDSTISETEDVLKRDREINQLEENVFSYPLLDDEFTKKENLDKNKLTQKDITSILTFTNVNYIINNIEFHKVLFGDPYQFAIKNGQLDETKRIKSFLSPRRVTFDSPEFNTFLNQEFNKAGDIELEPTDIGYHIHKSHANTVTLADIDIIGSLSDINPAYAKTNEADAASWIMDNTYREVKLKNGQWSDEAEAWHQWQMAYTRQNFPGYKYTNEKLEKHDVELLSTPEPKYTIDVLKPIVSGNKNNKNSFDIVLDKFSQMPVYYSAVKGTNLEKLYVKMTKEGIGYGIMISGRKVGAEQLHSLYTPDGAFNLEVFNNVIEVPWKSYGIQVENAYEGPKEQTRGSQLTKLSSLDLFNNGVASPEAEKEYARNKEILRLIHVNGYKNLLNKLGIEDNDGVFKLIDNVSVSQLLEREMLRREVSDNIRDVVQLNEQGQFVIPFEASASYIQIKDILYSMVDKAIVSPKMSGGAHVQVPVTMWESGNRGVAIKTKEGYKKLSREEYEALSEKDKEKVVLTDNTLKFYTKEDPFCEIMLPAWFKDKINKNRFKTDSQLLSYLNKTKEGQEILKGIGFRIPTQAMSSVEVFRVKGFLPSSMGATVVVPSEITTKSGSDFDIDKLNMYLKAVYIDDSGNIKLVRYKGNEQATKDFYSEMFDKKLNKQRLSKPEILEAFQILKYRLDDPKELVIKYGDILDSVLANITDTSEFEEKSLQILERLNDDIIQAELKKSFVDEMYKRSLENEYYDSLEKLITLPENFERLISPVNDAGLKGTSEKLDKLRGIDENVIKNKILNRNYMTSLRHAFVTGKKWVGIAAVNITGHSLAQKSEIHIDKNKFELLPNDDQKFLVNGDVLLPHNKTNNNQTSMSGVKTVNGKQYISDRLSGYATSFVDVAKDPYILKIIKSDLTISTVMFLERIGVGENTALFINQPIINKYIDYLDSIGSKSLFKQANIDFIKERFSTKQNLLNNAEIDVSSLAENISKYAGKDEFENEADNAIQHKILDEFLKYSKMAQYSFKLTQATNYDTTKFRSQDSLFKKQVRTQQARDNNIFSSVDKILDNSYIGDQSILLAYSAEAMGEILKLDKPDFRDITNSVLRPYAEDEYIPADKYDRIANKIMTSFIDYIVQTKTGLNSQIKALLVDAETSIAHALVDAKRTYPEIKILKHLKLTSSGRQDGVKSIKLDVNLKDAYDENLYTEMMRELRDTPETEQLYKDIVKLSILQGTYQSAISIANIIPIEDRAAIISPIINTLNVDKDLEAFVQGAFERNNWRDEDVFGIVNPKFFTVQDTPIGEDAQGNEIYRYYSPSFPNIPSLNFRGSDRKVLTLSELYNYLDVQSDFVSVPRVVTDRKTGEKIDMVNGTTVTPVNFAIRKSKGDNSLKDVFGYKKVKYVDGLPLLIFDKNGNASHVYKLINLYGDGQYATEHYVDNRPSVIDNGTVKIDNEIPDSDIIRHYYPNYKENDKNSNENIPECS